MNRRSFFSTFLSIPIVAKYWKPKPTPANLYQTGVIVSRNYYFVEFDPIKLPKA